MDDREADAAEAKAALDGIRKTLQGLLVAVATASILIALNLAVAWRGRSQPYPAVAHPRCGRVAHCRVGPRAHRTVADTVRPVR